MHMKKKHLIASRYLHYNMSSCACVCVYVDLFAFSLTYNYRPARVGAGFVCFFVPFQVERLSLYARKLSRSLGRLAL